MWLNGRQVLSHLVGHWCAPDQETVDLDLQAGENRLTIKITNGVLDAAFYFSLRPHAATANVLAPLWDQLVRDFPAAAQQIAWVRDDGIFSDDAAHPLLPLRRSASDDSAASGTYTIAGAPAALRGAAIWPVPRRRWISWATVLRCIHKEGGLERSLML